MPIKQTIPDAGDVILSSPGGIIQLIEKIGSYFYTILLSLAVIFIIMAAYNYLTSGGGEKVAKAHKMIVWTLVAIAVAFLSKGIVAVVKALLQ